MKLSVIIVNYNVKHYLYQCLRSVEAAIRDLDADVWVVDNKSKDGSVDFLKSYFSSVHFVENDENVGFSKANNLAIGMTKSDYVLLLNPDTIVTPTVIREGVQWLDEHPNAGAVGTSMHSPTGVFARESRRGIPTPVVSFCKIMGLSKLFPQHHTMGRYYMQYLDRSQPSKIEILSGAYMMLRRKALEEVGLLDEDFFMYGEDIDLSYRLLKGGYKNYYLPYPIIHYKGESEHPSTVRYVNVFHQAMIIFYEKHFSKRYFLSGLLIRLAVYTKAFVTLLKKWICGTFKRIPIDRTPIHFICYCKFQNREEILRCAHQLNAGIDFYSPAELPTNWSANSRLLFDTTIYDYSEIIDRVIAQQEQGKPFPLCTFHPEIGILMP